MTFERTMDYALVKKIATHPRIFPFISDDYSPSPENYQPLEGEGIWYVLVKDGEELLGMWAFAMENAVCWKVHTCLLPNAWGKRAKQAAREMAQWVWANTTCLRIITDVPEYNRLALKLAKEAGMVEFGRNQQSYMKSGILHDQIMLGISQCR